MGRHEVSLSDRFDLGSQTVLLSGTQALVRLMLMQSARDRMAGLHTAGYVTGYRGSPLGGVDMAMQSARGSPACSEETASSARVMRRNSASGATSPNTFSNRKASESSSSTSITQADAGS